MTIATWETSKWLLLSSFLLTIPAAFAFYHKLYYHSSLIFLTSLVSANYWRDATYSWRRNADLIVSKISFFTFVSTGVVYVRYVPYIVAGYSGLCLMVYFYRLSVTQHNLTPHWYKYHVLFHVVTTSELFLVLDSMRSKHV